MNLTSSQQATWQLIRTEGIGPATYHKLLKRYQTPEAAAKAWQTQAKTKIYQISDLEKEATALIKANGHAIFFGETNYPSLLSHIPDAPPLLHVLGNPALLNTQGYAIVGSRNASAAGLSFTQTLAADLAVTGATIVSGLARGIDTAAHQGTLSVSGCTVAVVAGGVDHLYPPENKKLREQIIAEGCLVSENPFGSTPTNRHFPRRNRIIAGLTRATIVMEATRHSGSLITATYAGDYGRDVYALPGSPLDPRAVGSNHLLKQGAQLVESAEDILKGTPLNQSFTPQTPVKYTGEDFTPDLFTTPTQNPKEQTENQPLLEFLSPTPTSLDTLIRQSGLPESQLLIELTELELMGEIQRDANGNISRK